MYETLKQAGYRYIKYLGNGEHLIKDETDSLDPLLKNAGQIWAANKNHASYGLIFKNTHLEFCRTVSLHSFL